ncbi:MAG TPA: LamG domain-containing protein, partial [Candidatus Subteraquimicrobiales bacterium]
FYHVAGVYTGSALKIYINGTEKASTPFGGAIFQNNEPIQIGGYNYPGQTHIAGQIKGSIDEVEIFDHALSETKIDEIVDAGIAGKCKPSAGANTSQIGLYGLLAMLVGFLMVGGSLRTFKRNKFRLF